MVKVYVTCVVLASMLSGCDMIEYTREMEREADARRAHNEVGADGRKRAYVSQKFPRLDPVVLDGMTFEQAVEEIALLMGVDRDAVQLNPSQLSYSSKNFYNLDEVFADLPLYLEGAGGNAKSGSGFAGTIFWQGLADKLESETSGINALFGLVRHGIQSKSATKAGIVPNAQRLVDILYTANQLALVSSGDNSPLSTSETSGGISSDSEPSVDDATLRLRELDALYEADLISREEYEYKRKAVLDGL